jgi:hypothetical protein
MTNGNGAMRYLLCLLAAAPLLVTEIARGDGEHVRYGPPASPLSWQMDEAKMPKSTAGFVPPHNLLGISRQPTSVKRAELQDQRPYGEQGRRTVWVVRYESVSVQAPDSSYMASVTLSLAFDASTHQLYCAFTEPAPYWLRPAVVEDIEKKAQDGGRRWTPSPAQYEALRSTPTEVLGALWRTYDVDPSKAGQIILRPRFVANKTPLEMVNGEAVPKYQPSNVWIVEVLGTPLLRRQQGVLTTLVAQFRDGDLLNLPTMTTY